MVGSVGHVRLSFFILFEENRRRGERERRREGFSVVCCF